MSHCEACNDMKLMSKNLKCSYDMKMMHEIKHVTLRDMSAAGHGNCPPPLLTR